MTTAIEIVTDAYGELNRLSPGETLNADDSAKGFRRLNVLVDELSAQNQFLFKDALTSAAQTGHITLGAGSWAAIAPGEVIISAAADGYPMSSVTMQQYNGLTLPTETGIPDVYAHDGLSTVYLYPVATGQTIRLQTRKGVSAFADQETDYTMAPGYRAFLAAALAVRLAPSTLGKMPPALLVAERRAMNAISKVGPAIVDVFTYTRQTRRGGSILRDA